MIIKVKKGLEFYFIIFLFNNYLLIDISQIASLKETATQLCQELGPHSLSLCDAFAITDTMLSAPIALNWVQYNTYDNQGELMSQKEWDENVRMKK